MFSYLPGSDPAAIKARKLQRDLQAKAASRAYDRHCAQCGMSAYEARRLAPKEVQRGMALRRIEAKQREREVIKARKEQMERRFGNQGRAT